MYQELYDLPKGWEFTSLGSLFDITSSKRVHKADWKSTGIPFYRAREIVLLSEHGFVDNELFITDSMYKEFAKKYGTPEENDIMVTGVGTIGVCYVVKKGDKFYFKDGNIIWLKNKSGVESRFIEYAFQSEFLKNQIQSATGAVVKTYTIIRAKNTVVPICSKSEQKRIVTKLDSIFTRIDTTIAHLQETLELSKALFASALDKSFCNGEKTTIGELATIVQYGLSARSFSEGTFPFVRMGDLQGGRVLQENFKYVDLKEEEFQKYALSKGDLLFNRTNSYELVGKTSLWTYDIPAVFASYLIRLRFDQCVLPEYVNYYLNSPSTQDVLKGMAARAINQSNINATKLKSVEIQVPTLEEQAFIVTHLDALAVRIRAIETAFEEKLKGLATLKSSLLDSAFRGQL